MAIDFTKECDVGQGFNFKQDEHFTFGFITGLVIGDTNLSPDFKVYDPLDMPAPPKSGKGSEGGAELDTSTLFKKPVVAVLNKVSWNTEPTGVIDLGGRITPSNMQTIYNLTMQSLKKLVIRIAFVVFEYDHVHNCYYPAYATHEGSEPVGEKPGKIESAGFGTDTAVKEIYGLLVKESNAVQLTANHTLAGDPPGFRNHEFTIKVAATAAKETQKIRIQTSSKNKMIKPWGLPTQ